MQKNVFCIKETLYKNIKGQANLFATELPEASRPVLAFMYIVHKKPSHIIQFFARKSNKKGVFAALGSYGQIRCEPSVYCPSQMNGHK